jgi:excisionase family DNA binding protein
MSRGTYAPPSGANKETQTDTKSDKKLALKKRRRMLSTTDAAIYLGVSESTFRRYRGQGRIPFHRVGEKLYRYDIADLDAFVTKTEAESA